MTLIIWLQQTQLLIILFLFSISSLVQLLISFFYFFFFQAEDGIRDVAVTGVQTCALPISLHVASFEAAERRMKVVGSLLVRECREADVAHLRMQHERGGYRGRLLRPLPRHAALDRDDRPVQAATLQAELGGGPLRARQADCEA